MVRGALVHPTVEFVPATPSSGLVRHSLEAAARTRQKV
ncbi:hypothetical protein CZ771_05970 [Actinomycetales bacterium JB111]|nr:hypothetical protein CZ771_05970 [Actinomycetales bacterium JB111]